MRLCHLMLWRRAGHNNQNGFSIAEVLVSVSIMSMLGMGAASLSRLTTQSSEQLRATRLVISARSRIEAALKNPVAWRNTMANNSSFNCISQLPGCVLSTAPDGYYDFVLYDSQNSEKLSFDPSDPTTRLSIHGGSCPAGTNEPSPDCPLKYKAQWRPACVTPCLQPTIEIKVSLTTDVSSDVFHINEKNYEFSTVRGIIEDTIQSACQTLNGIYNATTRTCRPKYAGKTCAALGLPYQIVTNVHSNGNIDCSPFYKGQCAPTELMTGIDSTGLAICTPKATVCVPNVDCVGSWSACSAACGPGLQTFTVTTAASGIGNACETFHGDARACINTPCPTTTTLPAAVPVSCQGSWSSCSASCGPGIETFVITTPAKNGGANCSAASGAIRGCNLGNCPPPPIDCDGSWGVCSRTCGGGKQSYSITTKAKNGGASCSYANGAIQNCNTQACPPTPVNCVGSWTSCTPACGGGSRTFKVSIAAANGGLSCMNNDGDVESCNTQPCPPPATPVNCAGSWGTCNSATGQQDFNVSQAPLFGGAACPTSPRACAVNCIGSWGACNAGAKTFTIIQPSLNGGSSCGYANGATDSAGCAPPKDPHCEFVSDSVLVGLWIRLEVGTSKTVDLGMYEKGGMDCVGVDGASCDWRLYFPAPWNGTYSCR